MFAAVIAPATPVSAAFRASFDTPTIFGIATGQLQDKNEGLYQQHLDRLELELQRSMDYFGRQHSDITVQRLLVSAPEQLGLAKLLASNLDLPVEQLDLTQVMDISTTPKLADSEYVAHVLPTLGAALRHERQAL